MFRPLLAASAVLELAGVTGALLAPFPSRWFSLSTQSISVGLVSALLAIVVYQRRSVDAAFDLGVEVGERRARKAAKPRPVVISLDEHRSSAEGA
jgi:hypothetical protein